MAVEPKVEFTSYSKYGVTAAHAEKRQVATHPCKQLLRFDRSPRQPVWRILQFGIANRFGNSFKLHRD